MGTPNDPHLAQLLRDLAHVVLTDTALKPNLERLVRLACRLVDDCAAASIAMLVDGQPSTLAVTDRVAMELDMVQYDNGDGPCIAALGGDVIRVGFVPTDERFPHFAVGAADRRVLSVLSTPAIDDGTVIGSLNIYSRRADAFDERARDIALVIVAEVATALVKSAAFATARTTRDRLQEHHDEAVLIARAQGALMAVNECSAAQARDLIERAAETNGERLIATAARILAATREGTEASSDA